MLRRWRIRRIKRKISRDESALAAVLLRLDLLVEQVEHLADSLDG
jgi:hypothetical protein